MADAYYRTWAAGRCPCCQSDVCEYEGRDGEVTEPKAIAEGVRICGRCSAMRHLEPPDWREALLKAIATRDDGYIDRLINGIRAQSL